MWNTKQRGKGKKINREFAFLSFSTPEEASTAIRWMHGACIEGLTKDTDGLTVQYEAQGTSKPAVAQAQAAQAAALAAGLHGPAPHAGLLQQQLALQQQLQHARALQKQQQQHAQQVQGLSMAGSLPPAGLGMGLPQPHHHHHHQLQQQSAAAAHRMLAHSPQRQAAMAAAAHPLMAAAAAAAGGGGV